MSSPKELTGPEWRRRARVIRDSQWAFMDRVLRQGTVYVCWWNKNRHFDETKPLPDDLEVHGLIDGLELMEWLHRHVDWWRIGEWSIDRFAAPVSLTDAGRAASNDRARYDMEPVTGGLVEPGWIAYPDRPTPDCPAG